jgi:uncharacterized membrane-anchored protein
MRKGCANFISRLSSHRRLFTRICRCGMVSVWPLVLTICMCILLSSFAYAQAQEPTIENLGSQAQVSIPSGFMFTGAEGAKTAMTLSQNITSGQEVGFIAPSSFDWYVLFEYNPVGYIRDNERDSLDADSLLRQIKEANAQANSMKIEKGWPVINITGWEVAPHYDQSTHNLEWAIRAESEGSQIVNFNTRLLGREGMMEVTLVCDPNLLSTVLTDFRYIIDGFSYKTGRRYEEVSKGDKVAEYGLTGLIVGGATAAAVKTGAIKWLWKLLVLGGAAVLAAIGKLFSGRNPKAGSA